MSAALDRSGIGHEVHFSHIPDAKFKKNLISVNFIMPLEAETASNNAVVPYILRKGFRECPDFSALQARLNELYGANLFAGISKVNGWQIIGISISGLDSRFALEGEDIAGACAALLASVVLDPKLDETGVFDEQDTALERQFILDTIEAEINEKRSYAIQRCMQTMCKGEPVAVRRYGDLDRAAAITPQSAHKAYRAMLETAPVEIFFTGSGDPSSARQIFTEAFSKVSRSHVKPFALIPLRQTVAAVKEEIETMDLSQSKLVMGMRAGEMSTPEELYAMRMCSAILGGTPFSKFFVNVRERLSLCYYCASSFDQYNRLFLVDSGIEAANKQLAQEEIMRQIQAVREGKVSDEELAHTKLAVANSIIRSTDSPHSMESWYLHQMFRGTLRSPEEDAEKMNQVTKEEIVSAAKKISLDTVYFLTGNGEGGEPA